jgi:hypothetical protein
MRTFILTLGLALCSALSKKTTRIVEVMLHTLALKEREWSSSRITLVALRKTCGADFRHEISTRNLDPNNYTTTLSNVYIVGWFVTHAAKNISSSFFSSRDFIRTKVSKESAASTFRTEENV